MRWNPDIFVDVFGAEVIISVKDVITFLSKGNWEWLNLILWNRGVQEY